MTTTQDLMTQALHLAQSQLQNYKGVNMFREKTNIKEISVKEFGIGSIIMMDGINKEFAYLLTTSAEGMSLYAVNLKTFVDIELDTNVENVNFLSLEEATSVFNELRDRTGLSVTRSDAGWLSSGFKTFKLEYKDD